PVDGREVGQAGAAPADDPEPPAIDEHPARVQRERPERGADRDLEAVEDLERPRGRRHDLHAGAPEHAGERRPRRVLDRGELRGRPHSHGRIMPDVAGIQESWYGVRRVGRPDAPPMRRKTGSGALPARAGRAPVKSPRAPCGGLPPTPPRTGPAGYRRDRGRRRAPLPPWRPPPAARPPR